jgi:hypothetical protein
MLTYAAARRWAPAARLDKDAVLRDERLSSVNSYWRLKPHLTVLTLLALLVQKY